MDEYDYHMHANKVIIDLFASRGNRLVSLSCNINMYLCIHNRKVFKSISLFNKY